MEKTFNANAKLNLLLDVVSRRSDGYHDISSVMQEIDLHDTVKINIVSSTKTEIKVSCSNAGDFPSVKWDETNLVYKAADAVLATVQGILKGPVSVSIEVHKNIPSGAGMAGGSADAAAVIKGLNDMLLLGMSTEELCAVGKPLGADIPFCITGGTALCEGIGEKITSLPSPGAIPCVILKPDVSLSTREMYSLCDAILDTNRHPDAEAMKEILLAGRTDRLYDSCGNFMEYAAVSICPGINDLKQALLDEGAAVSMMTGSGSAVFGLFDSEEGAKKAFERLASTKAQRFISHFHVR